jgi:hypothetical protein
MVITLLPIGGKRVDISEGGHFRQGYTVTGQASQGDQSRDVLEYIAASASHMMHQRAWYEALTRAKNRFRVYTNCQELIEQRALIPQDRESALINGQELAGTNRKRKINSGLDARN